MRLEFHSLAITLTLLCSLLSFSDVQGQDRPTAPNVVLIVADDLGYGDLKCFGSQTIPTPNLDALAADGLKLTNFCVSQPVCTASRASLMTGCYANRVGLEGALNHTSLQGIHPDEQLLPELFQVRGYATAIFGKWHLGTHPMFNPLSHGFDEFGGIPYSNDNSKYHPIVRDMPPLPYYDGRKVVELDADQSQFTRRLTDSSISFITRHREKPFFLYLPHIMPHVPIFASDAFQGKTGQGLYADVVAELDDSVGRIRQTLREQGLEKNTWLIFISDNGPFLSYGTHAGSAGVFREGKLTAFEGGVRVPCLMSWPGVLPDGKVSDRLVTGLDLLPTIAARLALPQPEQPIDGVNVWPALADPPSASPRETFSYYVGKELHAVRKGRWKLHLKHPYLTVNGTPGNGGKPANWENLTPKDIQQSGVVGIASRHGYRIETLEQSLFDLETDPGETRDVAAEHQDVVQELLKLAESARSTLGDTLTDRTGSSVRAAGLAEK